MHAHGLSARATVLMGQRLYHKQRVESILSSLDYKPATSFLRLMIFPFHSNTPYPFYLQEESKNKKKVNKSVKKRNEDDTYAAVPKTLRIG